MIGPWGRFYHTLKKFPVYVLKLTPHHQIFQCCSFRLQVLQVNQLPYIPHETHCHLPSSPLYQKVCHSFTVTLPSVTVLFLYSSKVSKVSMLPNKFHQHVFSTLPLYRVHLFQVPPEVNSNDITASYFRVWSPVATWQTLVRGLRVGGKKFFWEQKSMLPGLAHRWQLPRGPALTTSHHLKYHL